MKTLLTLVLALSGPCWGALTTVQDTLYTATGGYCSGTLTLSWQTFTAPDGRVVYAGSTDVAIPPAVNGLTVTLEPGQYTASYAITPAGCLPAYESWIVPASATAVNLAGVRSIDPPAPYTLISLNWLAQSGATLGQALLWNGAAYAPGNVSGTTTTTAHAVPCSSAPTFDLSLGSIQTMTLNCSISAVSTTHLSVGWWLFQLCQDGTGNRPFPWPAAVHGAVVVGQTALKCTSQWFYSSDGVGLYSQALGLINQ